MGRRVLRNGFGILLASLLLGGYGGEQQAVGATVNVGQTPTATPTAQSARTRARCAHSGASGRRCVPMAPLSAVSRARRAAAARAAALAAVPLADYAGLYFTFS